MIHSTNSQKNLVFNRSRCQLPKQLPKLSKKNLVVLMSDFFYRVPEGAVSSSESKTFFHVRVATERADASAVTVLVNEAFLADSWFKREECRLRMPPDGSAAWDTIRKVEEREGDNLHLRDWFLVLESPQEKEILGCVRVAIDDFSQRRASFSHLAAPEKGVRGVGTQLLLAVESFLMHHFSFEEEKEKPALIDSEGIMKITLSMPLISVRLKDLEEWYGKRGFQAVNGEVETLPPEVEQMVAEEWKGKVGFKWFHKNIYLANPV